MLNLSLFYPNFANLEDITSNSASFTEKLLEDFFNIFDDLYREEYYMLKLTRYDVIMDIMMMHRILTRIQLEILATSQENRLTYSEYLQKYHGDCLFKSLICRGVNIKKLMIAFDSGYSNINNIPTIISINDDNYIGGISWFGISGNTEINNDFILN
jgi:hypothetical protein